MRDYLAGLPAKIAEAVRQAEAQLTPAGLPACGHEESIAFNRRYHMTDGTVGWNPGKLNPAHPQARRDRSTPRSRSCTSNPPTGRPLAIYVNYAVHLDNVGEPKISADLPFTLARALADFKGPEMVTLFSAGCCGDVNHIDVRLARAQRGFANAARMGTILAAEVLRTWPRLGPVEADADARQAARSSACALPDDPRGRRRRGPARSSRGWRTRRGRDRASSRWCEAFKTRDVAARQGRPQEVEVQVIALGDELAWVSLPGEIFVELGLAIKQDSPFPRTIIAELANGVDRLYPGPAGLRPGELRGDQRPMRRGLGRAAGRRRHRGCSRSSTRKRPSGQRRGCRRRRPPAEDGSRDERR